MRTFKHLTWNDRLRIETLNKEGYGAQEIADRVRVHISTIYRELKRGTYERLNSDYTTEITYSPDIAHKKYKDNLKAKGAPLKIGNDHKLAAFIEKKIAKEKYSPAAVLGEIKAQDIEFNTSICVATLYTYIDMGLFLSITNKNLPVKGTRRNQYNKVKKVQARIQRGESIEKRPEVINERAEFGHWEMDCVEGKQSSKKTLLVLTERLARKELVIPMRSQTAECVVAALDNLERQYGSLFKRIFKTITVDNGSEFSDCAGMERSISGEGKRTLLYYCHPRNPQERGSNENANKLIRRHYPKGTDFEQVPDEDIAAAEEWINNYPRGIFDYHTAEEIFQKHMAQLVPAGCH